MESRPWHTHTHIYLFWQAWDAAVDAATRELQAYLTDRAVATVTWEGSAVPDVAKGAQSLKTAFATNHQRLLDALEREGGPPPDAPPAQEPGAATGADGGAAAEAGARAGAGAGPPTGEPTTPATADLANDRWAPALGSGTALPEACGAAAAHQFALVVAAGAPDPGPAAALARRGCVPKAVLRADWGDDAGANLLRVTLGHGPSGPGGVAWLAVVALGGRSPEDLQAELDAGEWGAGAVPHVSPPRLLEGQLHLLLGRVRGREVRRARCRCGGVLGWCRASLE